MRILFINNQHYFMGGAHTVYFNTAKLLNEHGHEVFYFSMHEEKMLSCQYSEFFPKAINYRELSFFSKIKSVKNFIYNSDAYDKLLTYIDIIKPDIAHIHLFVGGLTTSILKILKKNNIPIIQSVHDYKLLCPVSAFLNSKNQICEKCANKSYFHCMSNRCQEGNFFSSSILSLEAYFRNFFIDPIDYIDHFIFVSKFSQQKHLKYDNRFINKSSQLYNFTNIPEHISASSSFRYFLFLGRLSKEKGLLTLLDAAKKSRIKLKVAGTGPMETEVIEISKTTSNIEFLGYQSGDNLADLIKNSFFIVIPSICYENNPMTIVEAYSYGKPVIGARIGGIPEVILEGKTGYLFDPGNSDDLAEHMIKAERLENKEYNQMSSEAKAFANSNFSSKTHYQALIQIYSKTISNA